jgi:hypothetical protein
MPSIVTGSSRGIIAVNGDKLILEDGNAIDGNTVNGAFTSKVGQR